MDEITKFTSLVRTRGYLCGEDHILLSCYDQIVRQLLVLRYCLLALPTKTRILCLESL